MIEALGPLFLTLIPPLVLKLRALLKEVVLLAS